MAVEYNGKLYFACAGFPTSRLLQIDPETNETKVVMQKTAENSGFANGIRGLTVMDGKLLVSLATDGADPDNMFASGSQLPQAYQNAIKAMAKKDVRYKDANPRMQGVRLLSTTDPEDCRRSPGPLSPTRRPSTIFRPAGSATVLTAADYGILFHSTDLCTYPW